MREDFASSSFPAVIVVSLTVVCFGLVAPDFEADSPQVVIARGVGGRPARTLENECCQLIECVSEFQSDEDQSCDHEISAGMHGARIAFSNE